MKKRLVTAPTDYDMLTQRQQQALARREQILEVALSLFAKRGFDGTSTREIAQAADITEGLIFHYFPTKADLLKGVFETHHSFFGELTELLEDGKVCPTAEMLHTLAENWLATLWREREITRVLLSTAQINPEVGQALHILIQKGVERLSIYLSARVKADELRPDLPVETSAQTFFSSLIVFFIVNHSLSASEWQQRSDKFIQEFISIWLNGALA